MSAHDEDAPEDAPSTGTKDALAAQAAETARLLEDGRRLSSQLSEVAEYSAAVHDAAAELHEELGDAARLDPEQLRAHAERDRQFAAQERQVAAELAERAGREPEQDSGS